MLIRYEATFEGLLTAVAVCLRSGRAPDMMMPDLDQTTLLACTDIPAEKGIHSLFRKHLVHVLGPQSGRDVFELVHAAFLSEDEGIGLPIYRYLAAALHERKDPAGNLLDPDIARVAGAARRVGSQAHAWLGLLRFRQISPELFQADFSPDYHVLPLILPHFCERLPDQPFVIRDLRRDLAALHVPGKPVRVFVLAPPELQEENPAGLPDPLFSADSMGLSLTAVNIAKSAPIDPFDDLWRRYLSRMTIPERRNLKLQRANMPKKYWKYLTEQQ